MCAEVRFQLPDKKCVQEPTSRNTVPNLILLHFLWERSKIEIGTVFHYLIGRYPLYRVFLIVLMDSPKWPLGYRFVYIDMKRAL